MDISYAVGMKLPALKGKRFIVQIEKESPGFIVNRLTIGGNMYLNCVIVSIRERNSMGRC